AAGHEVVPRGIASTGSRGDVVESQVLWCKGASAILTGIVVTEQDVLSGKALSFKRDVDVFDQPDNRRQRHGEPGRVKPLRGTFFGVCDALQYQDNRTPSRANIDRLKGGVQNQNAGVHSESEI